MKANTNIEELIKKQAELLAIRLTQSSVWDLEEIKLVINVYFKNTMIDCLRLALNNIEKEREKYKTILNSSLSSKSEKSSAHDQLTKLKTERNKINKVLDDLEVEENYIALKKFVCDKFGKEELDEFFQKQRAKKKVGVN